MSDTVDTQGKKPVGNTKSSLRARFWFFTWNNYTVDSIHTLLTSFSDAEKYAFQEEKGENGTPHIQGTVGWKNARDIHSLKKIDNKIHWEKCISKKALDYCTKSDTRIGEPYIKGYKLPKPEITEFKDWQKEILDIIDTDPDDRTIYWIYDQEGGKGKTKLCRHLCKTRSDTIFVTGKANDMKYAVAEWIQTKDLKVCLLNFTRTVEGHISYEGIESIKDGLFFSGKYESKQIIYDPPHVFCFSNFLPAIEALTKNRWVIITL